MSCFFANQKGPQPKLREKGGIISRCKPANRANPGIPPQYHVIDHSILILMNPSLVSFIPCRPTLLGVAIPFPLPFTPLLLLLTLPPLLILSPMTCDPPGTSWYCCWCCWLELEPFGHCPAQPWLLSGDCGSIGLFWSDIPGETARRLKCKMSQSSSRIRLLPFFIGNSVTVEVEIRVGGCCCRSCFTVVC